jgi:hypothetical protein
MQSTKHTAASALGLSVHVRRRINSAVMRVLRLPSEEARRCRNAKCCTRYAITQTNTNVMHAS